MKYKCKDCEHIFESDQTVFECPQCGGTNIVEEGNFFTKYKRPIIIVSIIIAILLLLKLCCGVDGTTVNVKYDNESQRLEVELEGEKIEQYSIIVIRDGSEFSTKKYKDKPLNFSFDVPGEYRLQVKFVGNDKMPQISTYNKGPWIIPPGETIQGPITPQILEVRIQNTNTQSRNYTVKVITDINKVPLSDTEFSIDNSNYQSSDIFADLKPGLYTFYVRNAQDQSLINQFQFNLPTPPDPTKVLSDADLNTLLKRIANGDTNAFDRWRKEVDGAQPLPVAGVQFISNSYELAQDAITQNKVYTVRTQRDGNNKIVKIIVN